MTLVNWQLLRNPYNWIVIWLMIAIAALAVSVLDPLGATSTQGSPP